MKMRMKRRVNFMRNSETESNIMSKCKRNFTEMEIKMKRRTKVVWKRDTDMKRTSIKKIGGGGGYVGYGEEYN